MILTKLNLKLDGLVINIYPFIKSIVCVLSWCQSCTDLYEYW